MFPWGDLQITWDCEDHLSWIQIVPNRWSPANLLIRILFNHIRHIGCFDWALIATAKTHKVKYTMAEMSEVNYCIHPCLSLDYSKSKYCKTCDIHIAQSTYCDKNKKLVYPPTILYGLDITSLKMGFFCLIFYVFVLYSRKSATCFHRNTIDMDCVKGDVTHCKKLFRCRFGNLSPLYKV